MFLMNKYKPLYVYIYIYFMNLVGLQFINKVERTLQGLRNYMNKVMVPRIGTKIIFPLTNINYALYFDKIIFCEKV